MLTVDVFLSLILEDMYNTDGLKFLSISRNCELGLYQRLEMESKKFETIDR